MHTVALLTISNIFMTIAWYGHLKYKASPLWIVILVSWGICLCRVLFPGAGESHRPLPIQRCLIENRPGSDYPGRVLHLLSGLSEGKVEMELFGWFCLDDRRRVRHF
jgi:hypothetical protein